LPVGKTFGPFTAAISDQVAIACPARVGDIRVGGPAMRARFLLAALWLLAACAQQRLIVAHPNPTGEPVTVNSNAFGFGAVERRTVAECPTNLIDEVRIHQNLAQALATVLTLGLWIPIRIEYRCAKVPTAVGSTDQ
jgi:hypothetical protein